MGRMSLIVPPEDLRLRENNVIPVNVAYHLLPVDNAKHVDE